MLTNDILQCFLQSNNINAINGLDYSLQDNLNNNGTFIASWNIKEIEKPEITQEFINKYSLQYLKNKLINDLDFNYQLTKQEVIIRHNKTSTITNSIDKFIDLFANKRLLSVELQKNKIVSIEFTKDYDFIFQINGSTINLNRSQLLSLQIYFNDIRRGYFNKYKSLILAIEESKTEKTLAKLDLSIAIYDNISIDSLL